MPKTKKHSPRYIQRIGQVENLTAEEQAALEPVTDIYAFRLNSYYSDLIDWSDPKDPIRRLVIPDTDELKVFGEWDASGEVSYTVAHGLEHKYRDIGLLLVNNVCGAYCRFCFRKRLFTSDNDEVANDVSEALRYIEAHTEINSVLLSGGDPLVLSTRRLESILSRLREIDHVQIIRIGTKMPAFNPYRILDDPALLELLEKYSSPEKKIYLMAHFNHPRELTEAALRAIEMVQRAGVETVNQTPLIRGVNDDPETISELFNRLSAAGVIPYYLFICRPTAGNDPFIVPVEECLEIFEASRRECSGLARQARLCMSHRSGKIEVVGKIGDQIALRYHRSPDPDHSQKLMLYKSNPAATWYDDYLI